MDFVFYDENKLKKIGNWNQFIKLIYRVWNKKKTAKQEIVFRGGGEADEMFFSNNIYVAAVFSERLNAYVLNFKNPYILDCEYSDWMNINEPEIMKGESYDGTVSTDNIVDFIKREKKRI